MQRRIHAPSSSAFPRANGNVPGTGRVGTGVMFLFKSRRNRGEQQVRRLPKSNRPRKMTAGTLANRMEHSGRLCLVVVLAVGHGGCKLGDIFRLEKWDDTDPKVFRGQKIRSKRRCIIILASSLSVLVLSFLFAVAAAAADGGMQLVFRFMILKKLPLFRRRRRHCRRRGCVGHYVYFIVLGSFSRWLT